MRRTVAVCPPSTRAGISDRFPADLDDLLLDDPPDASQLRVRLKEWHKDIDGYRRRMVSFAGQLRRHLVGHGGRIRPSGDRG